MVEAKKVIRGGPEIGRTMFEFKFEIQMFESKQGIKTPYICPNMCAKFHRNPTFLKKVRRGVDFGVAAIVGPKLNNSFCVVQFFNSLHFISLEIEQIWTSLVSN